MISLWLSEKMIAKIKPRSIFQEEWVCQHPLDLSEAAQSISIAHLRGCRESCSTSRCMGQGSEMSSLFKLIMSRTMQTSIVMLR
jgi:hypothetical protein